MLKEKILSISIFALSLSIIVSSVIVYKGMELNGNYVSTGFYNLSTGMSQTISNVNNNNIRNSKDNMNLDSAAEYMGISVSDLVKLIHSEGVEFPYVKIGGNFIISKNALQKWLEATSIEIK